MLIKRYITIEVMIPEGATHVNNVEKDIDLAKTLGLVFYKKEKEVFWYQYGTNGEWFSISFIPDTSKRIVLFDDDIVLTEFK